MSDTTAGLLQVGLLVAALAACYRPLGAYMARVYTSDHDTRASSGSSTGSSAWTPRPTSAGRCTPASLLAFSAVSRARSCTRCSGSSRTCR